MKIIFIQCFDSPYGHSNRSYLFAKALDKINYEVTYYTNKYNHLGSHKKDKIALNSDNNIKHIFFDNKKFKKNKYLSLIINSFHLIKILKKNKYDIILGPSVPLINSFFSLIFKNKQTKFIFEIRDVWPDALIYNGIISKINPIYYILKIVEIFIYKFSDGLISALPKTHNYINRYNKSLPQLYLPNSYKPYPIFKKTFCKKNMKIIYVGRFNAGHDMNIILQSAKYLLVDKKINYITFDLYGYGDKFNSLKNFIKINNLKNVKLKGAVDKENIFELTKNYDVALCAITNSKAYQWGINLNKIYEYLNSSLPIIFSGDVELNPVNLAKCGFVCSDFNYFSLAKLILRYYSMSDYEKEKLSLNAKSYFNANYDLNTQVIKLDNFLKRL